MWIIPNNHSLHSRFAQDTVESKEDLSLLESSLMSSLMWRSKPSPLRTWLQRWKRESWVRHLFGRTLSPCQWSRFETELTSSLVATHASRSVPQGSEQVRMTPDTSGPISETLSNQSDLFAASSRTSKDTSLSDSEKSLATWKALVIKRRGEYSARLKLERLIRESECTSWPTPRTRDHKGGYQGGRIRNGKVSYDTLDVAVQHTDNKDKKPGHLNPTWVEWLMGVPTGWTELGSWETE